MDKIFRNRLEACGVDVEQGIDAHMGNEDMYERILRLVLSDSKFDMLFNMAVADSPEDIFDITHALKGTLGNVGLNELSDIITDICETTRKGSMDGVRVNIDKARDIYNKVMAVM